MSLSDRVAEGPAPVVHGSPCSVGVLHDVLPPDEAKALEQMLNDSSWSATQVYEVLRTEGYTVGRQTVNRHRGKRCRCYREST